MPLPVELERWLHAAIRHVDFFQALRLIEGASEGPGFGRSLRPVDDPLRLGQDPRFGFTSAQMGSFHSATKDRPARLTVNALGMMGFNGPMPLHFTEYVHERIRDGDSTLVAFLDVFHHRLFSLFYRAWADAEPVVVRSGAPHSGFVSYVGSLCGLDGPRATFRPGAIAHFDKLQFAGLLMGRVRHVGGLSQILSRYFGVRAQVRQFVGCWLTVPDSALSKLSRRRVNHLGKGLLLGRRVMNRQHKFRVVLGPVSAAESQRLQPGGASFDRLVEWVDLYAGRVLDWDVELHLKPEAATAMRFGSPVRLARDSWLGNPHTAGRPAVLRFRPRAPEIS